MDQQAANILYSQWEQIVLEANNSSISKRKWCQQNGISEKSFYYWQHKIRKKALTTMENTANALAPAAPAGNRFVEVPFPSGQTKTATAPDPVNGQPELMLQVGDCRIYVGSSIQETTLRTVMKVVRDA